jgi:hypothetical protein
MFLLFFGVHTDLMEVFDSIISKLLELLWYQVIQHRHLNFFLKFQKQDLLRVNQQLADLQY